MKLSRRTIVWTVIITLIVVVFGFIYFTFDPSKSGFFPKCLTMQLTGYRCPGCGSQRASHSLLHGDIAAAWRYNAMLVVALPVMLIYGVGDMMRARWRRFHTVLSSPWLMGGIFMLIIAWWIFRNIFGWYVP